MVHETRELYASPNDDRWFLTRVEGSALPPYILHAASPSAGGSLTPIDLSEFLSRGSGHPERQALLRLIGTLTAGFHDAI